MLSQGRVERMLSEARRCRFTNRCLLWHYAHDLTPSKLDGNVHCLAFHEIFDHPFSDEEYYEALSVVYTNTEHVCCGVEEV